MALVYASLPAVFVLFWSTGFIAGKQGLQDAAPFTFLLYRFLIVAALLTIVAWIARAPWPPLRALGPIAVGGVFVHAGYLGATFGAMSVGVEAGVSSLMAGLQPVLTAVFADKANGRSKPIAADFCGLSVPDRFVFGYGMDAKGAWRHLPEIYAMKETT